jgi:uncharacterized membrane protein YkvA (DUF1232 family)
MKFDKQAFLNNLSKYQDYYSPEKLMEKIKKYGRKAGLKVAYAALILFYASTDKGTSPKDRVMIFAALGYFILPFDLIPDIAPIGFTDDMAALAFVLKTIWNNLTPEVFAKARQKLEEWFGPVTDEEIAIPGIS